MIIDIYRVRQTEAGTLGVMSIDDIPHFTTLELPWRFNERGMSSIPTGIYEGEKIISQKYGETVRIKDVPGRSGILFHAGNYTHHTRGCVLVGTGFFNKKDDFMITNSREAMRRFREMIKGAKKLRINIDRREQRG